jgi:DNA polymerase III subunit alpha
MLSYVPLRVHSEYSLVDSTIRLEELIAQAKKLGLPAVAVTDELNLFALVKFFKLAEAAGIKPIIGADCWLMEDNKRTRFTLYCQNQTGYLNLCRLLSEAWTTRSLSDLPSIRTEWLQRWNEGLLLSIGFGSNVEFALTADDLRGAGDKLSRWAALFPDRTYVELSRAGRKGENASVAPLAQLAFERSLPCIATHEAVFLKPIPDLGQSPEDALESAFQAHEARVCIHDGNVLDDQNRPRRHHPSQYLQSIEEMSERFADAPIALENTLELAKRCNAALQLGTYYLPEFPTAEGLDSNAHLSNEAHAGLSDRIAKLQKLSQMAVSVEDYRARLDLELGVISRMGFAGYFLIVSDFIRWAKKNGVPVGPGRGSGAGSLVAYALFITDLDPIRYDLLFERFLNPERVSMPDFDVDFCMDRRDEVIQYVRRTYGFDKVSQIITYGTMAAKACIRDAGRVLGMSYGHTDSIAKLIPATLGIELKDALKESADLRAKIETDEAAGNLMRLALQLEGLTRNAGRHAGGVVIAPRALSDFTPLYSEGSDPDSVGDLPVTQFDKDDVEAIGLVKFDFLGLRTLTIIDWALQAINQSRQLTNEAPIDITEISLDDARTFALLCSGKTTAVFQLESRGMKELARKLKPNTFEDIIALGALFRPGPLQSGMVDEFVERKHGRREVVYAHDSLSGVLAPTYGVIVYQEQVMQIAQVMAGYTLGGADMLRRAMGKKKPEEMAKQRAIFAEGAAKNQIDAVIASSTFDLMEKFAEYGFNKSHSAAYAMVTYQTAYLKAYYPAEFMAAVLSSEADNTDKINDFLLDARDFGLRILPPDVEQSQAKFSAQEGPQTIRYGLSAIKGVGAAVCEEIIKARASGAFRDLHDFIRRLSGIKPNRRVLEALIDSGALDRFGAHRALLHAELGDALKSAEKQQRDADAGQFDMFGAAMPAQAAKTMMDVSEFAWVEKLTREKAVLGGYFSGHPLDQQRAEFAALGCPPLIEISKRAQPESKGEEKRRFPETPMLVVGEIEAIRRRDTMSFAKFGDGSGATLEVGFFKDAMLRFGDLLKEGERLLIAGGLAWDPFSSGWQLKVKQAYPIDVGLAKANREVTLTVSSPGQSFVANLANVLKDFRGGHSRVIVELELPDGKVSLELGAQWRVRANSDLKTRLKKLGGVLDVTMHFDAARLFELDNPDAQTSNFDAVNAQRYHLETRGDAPEPEIAPQMIDEAEFMAFADQQDGDIAA